MYTQFFGNYLLSHDYVTKEQLFSAMRRESNEHMKLGTLAIHEGIMTASEVDNVIILQTHEDKKFGEIAIEEGYLTREQVIHLLKSQAPDFLILGQILVEEGSLSNHDLENIITDYRSQNELYDLDLADDNIKSIEKIFNNYFVISETPLTHKGRMYMELLFNNLIRFVGEDFTPVSISEIIEFPTVCCSSQTVSGLYGIKSYLDMDEETAIEFASRYAGENFNSYNEYVQASLEDFLNLHNGLFAVNVSNELFQELTLDAPEQMNNQLLSFEHTTYHFPIMYSFGTIHIILEIIRTQDDM